MNINRAPESDLLLDVSDENFEGISLPSESNTRKQSYSFNLQNETNRKTETQMERKSHLTIDDEMQLTLLNVDRKQVSEVIDYKVVIRGTEMNVFQCYYYDNSKEFYMRIGYEENQSKFLSKEILLNLLDLAEDKGAKKFYTCIDYDNTLKNKIENVLQFVGFRKLSAREQKQTSLCTTHQLLQYNLVADDT